MSEHTRPKVTPVSASDADLSTGEQDSMEEDILGEAAFEDEEKKRGASGGVVAITIPSIEYPDQYKTYLPLWRQEFKEEGLVHCPNYKVCGESFLTLSLSLTLFSHT